MEWILANGDALIKIAGGLLGVALAVVALTPTEKDDKIVGRIKNVFDKLFGGKK